MANGAGRQYNKEGNRPASVVLRSELPQVTI